MRASSRKLLYTEEQSDILWQLSVEAKLNTPANVLPVDGGPPDGCGYWPGLSSVI